MNNSNFKIDFIIPAYNSEKTIRACIESVKANLLGHDSKIIIINNNSSDGTEEITKAMDVDLIHCHSQGRSFARNTGLRHSQADYVAFIDSDVILDKDWLKNLLPYFDIPSIAGVQGAVIPYPETNFLNKFLYNLKSKNTHGTFINMETSDDIYPLIDTAACIYRRRTLLSIGGFDEKLNFHEDYDLSIRVVAGGFSIAANAQALAFKDANRTPVGYLLRTIEDSKTFSHYVLRYSRPRYFSHLFDACDFKSGFGIFGLLYNLTKYLSYLFFYSYYSIKMKNNDLEELKVSEAKINLMAKELIDERGNRYRLSPSVRFYIGVTGIRYFSKKLKSKIEKDKRMNDFFISYLQGKITQEDFEINKEKLLSKKIIIKLSA